MALVKCDECGKEVSAGVKTCPCGRAVPKKTSLVTWLVVGFVGLVFMSMMLARSDPPSGVAVAAVATNATTAQAAAPESKKLDEDSADAIKAANLALNLRNAAREPNSFKLTDAYRTTKGGVCIKYRAQNGFGGMSVGKALQVGTKFKTSDSEGFSEAWNHYCVGKTHSLKNDVTLAFKLAGQCGACVENLD
jgi:hypothetical protein